MGGPSRHGQRVGGNLDAPDRPSVWLTVTETQKEMTLDFEIGLRLSVMVTENNVCIERRVARPNVPSDCDWQDGVRMDVGGQSEDVLRF
jgi:hypothetical protein